MPIQQYEQQRDQEFFQEILKAIQGIRFGSVEITIHDSKVVQIERKEKVRFANERSTIMR
jgi:hypothetical protein